MPVNRKKRNSEEAQELRPKAQAAGRRGRKTVEAAGRSQPAPAKSTNAELEVDWLEGGQGRVNQQEVEDATDRVFESVLSRYGWMRDPQGHIEHVGAERH